MGIRTQQDETCDRIGVDPEPPQPGTMVGFAFSRGTHLLPLNAIRNPPAGQGNGWFVWRGEEQIPQDHDFFAPVHVEHLADHAPELMPYLSLPPGWAVVLAPDYEDVWFDETLLNT